MFFSRVHFSCSTCTKGHFTIRTFAYGSHCLYSTMESISFTKFTMQLRRRLFNVSQFQNERATSTEIDAPSLLLVPLAQDPPHA